MDVFSCFMMDRIIFLDVSIDNDVTNNTSISKYMIKI